MTTRSLRLRLLLLGALSVALALIASTIGLVFLFERHVERRVDAELNAYLNQLIAGLDRDADGGIASRSPADPRFERPLSGLYWQVLIEPTATVLRSRSLWDSELTLAPDALPKDRCDATGRRAQAPRSTSSSAISPCPCVSTEPRCAPPSASMRPR